MKFQRKNNYKNKNKDKEISNRFSKFNQVQIFFTDGKILEINCLTELEAITVGKNYIWFYDVEKINIFNVQKLTKVSREKKVLIHQFNN